VSPLRNNWHRNVGRFLRINGSWWHIISETAHCGPVTWNTRDGLTVNVKRLIPPALRRFIPGRLVWREPRR
jgi:hypothetical protein